MRLPPPSPTKQCWYTYASYSFAAHYLWQHWFWGAGNRIFITKCPNSFVQDCSCLAWSGQSHRRRTRGWGVALPLFWPSCPKRHPSRHTIKCLTWCNTKLLHLRLHFQKALTCEGTSALRHPLPRASATAGTIAPVLIGADAPFFTSKICPLLWKTLRHAWSELTPDKILSF